jgi:hypothetical protein
LATTARVVLGSSGHNFNTYSVATITGTEATARRVAHAPPAEVGRSPLLQYAFALGPLTRSNFPAERTTLRGRAQLPSAPTAALGDGQRQGSSQTVPRRSPAGPPGSGTPLAFALVMADAGGRSGHTWVQVQVQVCFTSVCGQVQPLDVALSNSVRHSHAIAVAWGLMLVQVQACFTSVDGQVRALLGQLFEAQRRVNNAMCDGSHLTALLTVSHKHYHSVDRWCEDDKE